MARHRLCLRRQRLAQVNTDFAAVAVIVFTGADIHPTTRLLLGASSFSSWHFDGNTTVDLRADDPLYRILQGPTMAWFLLRADMSASLSGSAPRISG